jgi:hypothetical protein
MRFWCRGSALRHIGLAVAIATVFRNRGSSKTDLRVSRVELVFELWVNLVCHRHMRQRASVVLRMSHLSRIHHG